MENILKVSNNGYFEEIKSKLLVKNNNQNCIYDISIDELFKSFYINNVNLKNHFAFINLSDDSMYDNFGLPNNKYFDFYNKIARSGVGLIVTAGAFCRKNKSDTSKASSISIESGALKIHTDFVNKIHTTGSKIFFQIKSIFGRGDIENKFLGVFNVSASNLKNYNDANMPCIRISDTKCLETIDSFTELANFSINAGYDGVVINAEISNIVGELSSKSTNKRKFGYFSNKIEFLIRILTNIKEKCGKINIFCSFTIDDFLKEIYEQNLKYLKSAKNINKKENYDEICNFVDELIKNGIDGFIFKFGTFETEFLSVFNGFQEENIFKEFIESLNTYFVNSKLKNKFGNNVSVIYVDNNNSLVNSANLVQTGVIELVDITRNLYSDECFLYKIRNNKKFRPCIKCGYCNELARKKEIGCLVNPIMFEDKLQTALHYKNKNVAIIGAGVSGISCANYLAERGFSVDIYEMNNVVNKNGRLSEIYGFDKSIKSFNDFIESMLTKNINDKKINLYLKQSFDLKYSDKDYFSIIVATGFHEKLLDISGSILKNVKSIYDVLANKKLIDKDNIVILAKSELSFKLALYLLTINKNVSIIIPSFEICKNIFIDRLEYYLYEFKEHGANVYINARIKKIENDFVEIVLNQKFEKYDYMTVAMNLNANYNYGYEPKITMIDADLFIYEPELYENNKMYYELVMNNYKGELYMIGNALQVSDLASDIKSAYYVAKNL